MNSVSVEDLIRLYGLREHPEGGYFKETYRAAGKISRAELKGLFPGDRNFLTGIYFLLTKGQISRLHRIRSDEMWHFYLGGPLTIAQISPGGQVESIVLGPDIKAGQKLQHVVPAGCWFGAYPREGREFSFVGCTVAPGFDPADFEMADRAALLAAFPQAADVIEKLT